VIIPGKLNSKQKTKESDVPSKIGSASAI